MHRYRLAILTLLLCLLAPEAKSFYGARAISAATPDPIEDCSLDFLYVRPRSVMPHPNRHVVHAVFKDSAPNPQVRLLYGLGPHPGTVADYREAVSGDYTTGTTAGFPIDVTGDAVLNGHPVEWELPDLKDNSRYRVRLQCLESGVWNDIAINSFKTMPSRGQSPTVFYFLSDEHSGQAINDGVKTLGDAGVPDVLEGFAASADAPTRSQAAIDSLLALDQAVPSSGMWSIGDTFQCHCLGSGCDTNMRMPDGRYWGRGTTVSGTMWGNCSAPDQATNCAIDADCPGTCQNGDSVASYSDELYLTNVRVQTVDNWWGSLRDRVPRGQVTGNHDCEVIISEGADHNSGGLLNQLGYLGYTWDPDGTDPGSGRQAGRSGMEGQANSIGSRHSVWPLTLDGTHPSGANEQDASDGVGVSFAERYPDSAYDKEPEDTWSRDPLDWDNDGVGDLFEKGLYGCTDPDISNGVAVCWINEYLYSPNDRFSATTTKGSIDGSSCTPSSNASSHTCPNSGYAPGNAWEWDLGNAQSEWLEWFLRNTEASTVILLSHHLISSQGSETTGYDYGRGPPKGIAKRFCDQVATSSTPTELTALSTGDSIPCSGTSAATAGGTRADDYCDWADDATINASSVCNLPTSTLEFFGTEEMIRAAAEGYEARTNGIFIRGFGHDHAFSERTWGNLNYVNFGQCCNSAISGWLDGTNALVEWAYDQDGDTVADYNQSEQALGIGVPYQVPPPQGWDHKTITRTSIFPPSTGDHRVLFEFFANDPLDETKKADGDLIYTMTIRPGPEPVEETGVMIWGTGLWGTGTWGS